MSYLDQITQHRGKSGSGSTQSNSWQQTPDTAIRAVRIGHVFCLCGAGRGHQSGDAFCHGCERVDGQFYPRPHSEYGKACLGMVHAENWRNPTTGVHEMIYYCDGCGDSLE